MKRLQTSKHSKAMLSRWFVHACLLNQVPSSIGQINGKDCRPCRQWTVWLNVANTSTCYCTGTAEKESWIPLWLSRQCMANVSHFNSFVYGGSTISSTYFKRKQDTTAIWFILILIPDIYLYWVLACICVWQCKYACCTCKLIMAVMLAASPACDQEARACAMAVNLA